MSIQLDFNKGTVCVRCEVWNLLIKFLPWKKINYWYWVATELFVRLHNGKDWCDK